MKHFVCFFNTERFILDIYSWTPVVFWGCVLWILEKVNTERFYYMKKGGRNVLALWCRCERRLTGDLYGRRRRTTRPRSFLVRARALNTYRQTWCCWSCSYQRRFSFGTGKTDMCRKRICELRDGHGETRCLTRWRTVSRLVEISSSHESDKASLHRHQTSSTSLLLRMTLNFSWLRSHFGRIFRETAE